jgi:hypothetical protein
VSLHLSGYKLTDIMANLTPYQVDLIGYAQMMKMGGEVPKMDVANEKDLIDKLSTKTTTKDFVKALKRIKKKDEEKMWEEVREKRKRQEELMKGNKTLRTNR